MISVHKLEARVLGGLRAQLISPAMFEEFAREFRTEWKRWHDELTRSRTEREQALYEAETKIRRLIDAIEAGADIPEMRDRLKALITRKKALAEELHQIEQPNVIDLPPDLPAIYQNKVIGLEIALNRDDDTRSEAVGILRSMIDRIVLHPGERRGQMGIELHGSISSVLSFACEKTGATGKSPEIFCVG